MMCFNVDCLLLIINELRDKNTLYSCLLVNREWCRLLVPILWKKYSWCNKDFFNTILSWLPSSSKQLLSNNIIKLPSTTLLKPPLFNYISFCKFPDTKVISKFVEIVLGKFNRYDRKNLLEQEIYKLFVSQCKNIKEFIWQNSQPLSLFPGASTCFSQLYSLSIYLDCINSNSLHEMAQICKYLNKLEIYNCSQDLSGIISLIDAQRNLKSIKIYHHYDRKGNYQELSNALEKKGNTIKYFHLDLVNSISASFLTSLVNLMELSIYERCKDIKMIEEFKQYLAISEFPNLQILRIDGLSCFRELAMLIEKTKGNLIYIYVFTVNETAKNTGMLIEAIANNCPKIKCLYTYLEPKDFSKVKSLLLNCRNLEQIILDSNNSFVNENNYNIGDELLDVLTKYSSNSLFYIAINENWKFSIDSLNQFFENFRGRSLSYFDLIHKNKNNITENLKGIVRKYIDEGVIKNSNIFHNY